MENIAHVNDTDSVCVEIAIVGAGMAGLMTWVGDAVLRLRP